MIFQGFLLPCLKHLLIHEVGVSIEGTCDAKPYEVGEQQQAVESNRSPIAKKEKPNEENKRNNDK